MRYNKSNHKGDNKMKKWHEWSKKQKYLLVAAAVVAVGGGGIGVKVYADNQYKQQVVQTMKELEKQGPYLDDLYRQVLSFSDADFLLKDISEDNLTNVLHDAENYQLPEYKVKDKQVMAQVNATKQLVKLIQRTAKTTEEQYTLQNNINSLFKEAAVNGRDVKKELAITDDLKLADVEKYVADLDAVSQLEKQVTPIVEKQDYAAEQATLKDSEWAKAMRDVLDNAKKQVEDITNLTKKVDGYFKDGKPQNTAKAAELTALKKDVEKIQNDKAKKGLLDKLSQVIVEVDKKEKAAAEKKAKESGGSVVKKDDGSYVVESAGDNSNSSSQAAAGGNSTSNNNASVTTSNAGGGSYTAPATNNGGGGSYTPPASNSGDGGTSTPPANNNGGGWSANVDMTEGGDVADFGNSNGATGGGNTWTGSGELSGEGFPDW